jgi:hypothetical protein
VCDLERGQDAVVVEPAEQEVVAGSELGLHPQYRIIHGVPQGEKPADMQGLSEHNRLALTGGLTCGVRTERGSVRASG